MSSLIKQVLFILLLLLVTLPAIAKNTILIMGDSLSTAYGMQPEQGWVFLLQKRLKEEDYHYKIVNISVTGATTSNGLALLPKALEEHKPDITIIELGGNDGLRGLPAPVIRRNLGKLVIMSKKAGSKVLLLGVRLPPNYGEKYINQFTSVFRDVADEYDISVVPMVLKNIGENRDLFQGDGIHPKASAQPIILDNIWPSLKLLFSK